ncbi:ABC transporter substrate-binding protein [Stutzerimonas urumqiensis]|uniref:substrate-binding periplasmic protein n=1 Tax=Stutzerimonas urumqiensis TaxID=638269 RepID=UPI003BAA815F
MLKPALAAFSLLLCATANAELPPTYKVTVQTENFPPFNMADNAKNFAYEKNISGINTEIVQEMFRRAEVPYDMALRFPWSRIYDQTLEKADHALFSTTFTEARKPLFKWVGPLAGTGWVLLARPGSDLRLGSLVEAASYKVGAYKNDAVSQYLEGQGLEPINALQDSKNVDKLLKGEIDLWATTDPVGPYLAKQEGVTGLATALRFSDAELFLAFNLDTPDEVIQRLQAALDAMKADGTVEQIKARYL